MMLPLFFILVILSGLWWCIQLFAWKEVSSPSRTAHLDSFMTQVRYEQYDPQGLLRTLLLASKISYYSAQHIMQYSKPILTLYNSSQGTWHLSANQGMSDPEMKKLHLYKQVLIIQSSSTKEPETAIRSEAITITSHPLKFKAHQPVTITRSHLTLRAQNMQADF